MNRVIMDVFPHPGSPRSTILYLCVMRFAHLHFSKGVTGSE